MWVHGRESEVQSPRFKAQSPKAAACGRTRPLRRWCRRSPRFPLSHFQFGRFRSSGCRAALEFRISKSAFRTSPSLQPHRQVVWSVRYTDALVRRDTNDDADDLCDDETLYALGDANFNTTALVNAAGTVLERYVYDPYGRVTVTDGTWTGRAGSLYESTVLFAGYWRDTETGLYHVRNRMYHVRLGLWLIRDPEGYVDGMSLYEYVGGNATLRRDLTGLDYMLVDAMKAKEVVHVKLDKEGKKTTQITSFSDPDGAPTTEYERLKQGAEEYNARIDVAITSMREDKPPTYRGEVTADGAKPGQRIADLDAAVAELEKKKVHVEKGKATDVAGAVEEIRRVARMAGEAGEGFIYESHSRGVFRDHKRVGTQWRIGGKYIGVAKAAAIIGDLSTTGAKDLTLGSCLWNRETVRQVYNQVKIPVAATGKTRHPLGRSNAGYDNKGNLVIDVKRPFETAGTKVSK